jgi:hypothetical protein
MLFEEQTIGTKINELFAANYSRDYLVQLFEQKWFSARDGNHGGTAFINRRKTLIHS